MADWTLTAAADAEARIDLAMEAAWEIEAMTLHLVSTHNGHAEKLWQRGIYLRLKELSHVIMGALGDEVDKPSKIEIQLRGPKVELDD